MLGVIFHHHEDDSFYDDCLVCIAIANNTKFLSLETCQAHSDDRVISTVSLFKDLIVPYILKLTISVRAPPT